MRGDVDNLDEQIERLRNGGTLTENEVKILCDKVSELLRFMIISFLGVGLGVSLWGIWLIVGEQIDIHRQGLRRGEDSVCYQ